MNHQHKSIERRVRLFRAFLRRENARPLFGFSPGSEFPLPRYPSSRSLPENRPLAPDDFDPGAYAADAGNLFLETEKLGGDFIFGGSAFWGIPWLEALLGCPLFASHTTNSIRAGTPLDFSPGDIPAFSPGNPWARLMSAMLDALARRAAGRFPLATTRMRGVADLLSSLYGGTEFVMAMFDRPDEVRRTAEKLTDLFISAGQFQLDRIPLFHGGVGSFFYNAWMPPGTVWHQEDAVALLSPELYARFIEPCDRRIAAAFPHLAIHQHSTGFVPTGAYLKMGMDLLEMHIDTGGPTAAEIHEKHLSILRERPLLIWGKIPPADLDWIFTKLPHQGLAVLTMTDSPETASRLWTTYAGSSPD
ncbi:MAG: hypothetical protein LBC18_14765 [Opitutaceae bacterium]|jgi:hypothetical protein|nr:hypothetical protein [Opitutaceae bacterium]